MSATASRGSSVTPLAKLQTAPVTKASRAGSEMTWGQPDLIDVSVGRNSAKIGNRKSQI
jgi:hypothetical protein